MFTLLAWSLLVGTSDLQVSQQERIRKEERRGAPCVPDPLDFLVFSRQSSLPQCRAEGGALLLGLPLAQRPVAKGHWFKNGCSVVPVLIYRWSYHGPERVTAAWPWALGSICL